MGATHKGFPEEMTEVRNTFGSNLSFKAEVLKVLDGFRGEMGVKGKGLLQGEETELCERMSAISFKKSFLAGIFEKGNEGAWLFDERGVRKI